MIIKRYRNGISLLLHWAQIRVTRELGLYGLSFSFVTLQISTKLIEILFISLWLQCRNDITTDKTHSITLITQYKSLMLVITSSKINYSISTWIRLNSLLHSYLLYVMTQIIQVEPMGSKWPLGPNYPSGTMMIPYWRITTLVLHSKYYQKRNVIYQRRLVMNSIKLSGSSLSPTYQQLT